MSVMKSHGFTVIELIVIIVVIGILAGIVTVAWPNYMKQTHDGERRNDLQQVASALKVYALQKNSTMTTSSGCGKNGNGNGWVGRGGTADYPKSILACLQEIEALPGEPLTDPSGCTYDSGGTCTVPVRAYMKATCLTGGVTTTYLFAHLETEPANATTIDGLCTDGSVSGFDAATQKWGSLFGMNYYLKVD
jgi:type II secretory pathway pseudopilin PulG